MKKPLAFTLASALALAGLGLTALSPLPALAGVVRPSPDFALTGGKSIKTLHGQPVVLIIAPSPRSRSFRKQVRRLEEDYEGFAARNAVFVVAFTENSEGLRSSIPFAVARNGAEVATRFGITSPFGVVVIGKDGNVDFKTAKLVPASRVRDVILNNFELQAAERRL